MSLHEYKKVRYNISERYILGFAMFNIFAILMFVAMAAVLISLCMGIFSMIKGGEFNKKYGTKLMRLRVMLQGVAILFFILAVVAK